MHWYFSRGEGHLTRVEASHEGEYGRYGPAITDALFMTSRDGRTFKRWPEAFLRPGPREKDSWVYGDNYIHWGIVETKSTLEDAPNEISMYASEGYWQGESTSFRRLTLRLDGFVSAHAPLAGGEIVTKPIRFEGGNLVLNLETSAAGGDPGRRRPADRRLRSGGLSAYLLRPDCAGRSLEEIGRRCASAVRQAGVAALRAEGRGSVQLPVYSLRSRAPAPRYSQYSVVLRHLCIGPSSVRARPFP